MDELAYLNKNLFLLDFDEIIWLSNFTIVILLD